MSLLGGDPTDHLPQRGGKVVEATFGLELTNSPNKRGLGVAASANGEVAKPSPRKPRRGESIINGNYHPEES